MSREKLLPHYIELEDAAVLRPSRRRVAVSVLALAVLLVGSVVATDALARHGVKVPNLWLRLWNQVAQLVDRVDAIEQTDCGCPGLLEPVCVNGRTWQNRCEATCALGRLDDGPAFLQFSQGPCDNANPVCGEFACTEGHVCIDGVCSRGECEGRQNLHNDCESSGCARGYHCATYPEVGCVGSVCTCDPRSGATLCTSDCSGSICVPDDGRRPVVLPPGSLDLDGPITRR